MTKEKFLKTIEWFILLHPVLDFLTSLMVRFVDLPLTLGMILRILFTGIAVVYLAFFYDGKYKKTILIYLGAVVVYGLISIGSNAYFNGLSSVFENAKMFFKIYYFVFVLALFYALYQKEGFLIKDKILGIIFLEYSASIFLSAITNTSFVTYKYAEGFVGWFYAASEVGAIIAMLAGPALLWLFQTKKWYLKAIIGALLCFSATYIGTKVPFIAVLGAIVVLLVFLLLRIFFKQDRHLRNALLTSAPVALVLLLFFCLYQWDSPMKANNTTLIEYHYDSNVTENITEKDPAETPAPTPENPAPAPAPQTPVTPAPAPDQSSQTAPKPDSTPSQKPSTEILSPEEVLKDKSKAYLILNWLLSDRLYYFDGAITAFEESTLFRQMIGLGHQFKFADNRTLIEMDFMALLINQGILGLLLALLPILYFAVVCIRLFFKQIRRILQMTEPILYIYSVLIGLFSAFLAGHVLVAPAVSIYVALLIINLYGKLERENTLAEGAGQE